jgi:hypothetical protein
MEAAGSIALRSSCIFVDHDEVRDATAKSALGVASPTGRGGQGVNEVAALAGGRQRKVSSDMRN